MCGAHRRIRPRRSSSLCSGMPFIPSRILLIGQGLAICFRNLRYTMIALECYGSIKSVYISIDVERITAETWGLDFHFLLGQVLCESQSPGLIRGTHNYWYSWIHRYIYKYLYVFMKFKEITVTSPVLWNFF
jgi:hypothetical protein